MVYCTLIAKFIWTKVFSFVVITQSGVEQNNPTSLLLGLQCNSLQKVNRIDYCNIC